MIPLGDALGFIITASVLFLFAIAVGGYFLISLVSQIFGKPKEQVLSVGHSILDEPAHPASKEHPQDSSKAA